MLSRSFKIRFTLFAFAISVLSFSVASRARSQVLYGTLVGAIEDPSGGVVPKAEVRMRNLQSGVTRQAQTDDS